MAVAEDAFKLLGRVADAFDDPSSHESRKDFQRKHHQDTQAPDIRKVKFSMLAMPAASPLSSTSATSMTDDELADMASMTANRSCTSLSETIRSLTGMTSHVIYQPQSVFICVALLAWSVHFHANLRAAAWCFQTPDSY
ncbi:uncharacterized protein F5147DRAFT_775834 [Suillus discolor]|uniref:Uncharacterized protein n=1 Tax=Suillus discolor TaxID=1912936 RepID=A0A9P7JRZ0_9AGAM|nr:uncharacterized protein F5147DRAFT_775834 [Suillus discolor]KAG2103708.1 hypothetical protein F5147DRAFT_775834 [Suillus discolor]